MMSLMGTMMVNAAIDAKGSDAGSKAVAEPAGGKTPSAACRGMMGQNIVCFAKDWDEDPTSNNHIMQLLSQHNRVLWLNSIATRKPKLTSGRDLGKIVRKLRSFLRGPQQMSKGLWVYTPVVLPLPHSRWAAAMNRWILRVTLGRIRRGLGMNRFQLWIFIPTAAPYVGRLGESLVVYYVTDEYSKFGYVNGDQVAQDDCRICKQADIVFATAKSLVERRQAWNAETHLARHGVDYDEFARALDPRTQAPADIASLPQPIVGFYGTLQDWIDQELIARVAEQHPEWSVVLIGKVMVDLSRLKRFPNVHVLGRRDHSLLPSYCKAFSVGMIPYVLDDRIIHVNPIKLREYLSAGVPVVSVALPEVEDYAGVCTIARDPSVFVAAIEKAVRDDSAEARRQRSDAMRSETWAHRVEQVGAEVMRVSRSRDGGGRR